jgi:class 3 adenylate cyclase
MVELGVFQQEPARAGTQRGEDILVDVEFIGDAVVAVFGAPVSHEDDPERAVRAALRVLEATELDVRIAGNTGGSPGRPRQPRRARRGDGRGNAVNGGGDPREGGRPSD